MVTKVIRFLQPGIRGTSTTTTGHLIPRSLTAFPQPSLSECRSNHKSQACSANKHGNGEMSNDLEPGELEDAPFCVVRPRARDAARPEAVPDGALTPGGPVGVHRDCGGGGGGGSGGGGEGLGARRVSSARRGGRRGDGKGQGRGGERELERQNGGVRRCFSKISDLWRWDWRIFMIWARTWAKSAQPWYSLEFFNLFFSFCKIYDRFKNYQN